MPPNNPDRRGRRGSFTEVLRQRYPKIPDRKKEISAGTILFSFRSR